MRKIIGEEGKLASSSSNTKLYAEDWKEVQQRCVGGQTESAELRDLVHSGLQRERYRKAASDPAIRELLRTFQDMIEQSLSGVETRLSAQIEVESSLAAKYLLHIYPMSVFAAEALRQIPRDLAPDELREQAWDHYFNMYDEIQDEARKFTESQVKTRNDAFKEIREGRQESSIPE
jgi:hypothetical protein